MYFLVLLSALLVCAAGVPPNNSKPRLDGRIAGGTVTDITSHPYQVAVLQFGSYACGGSIISENWVVTLAFCVSWFSTTDFTIRSGSTYSNSGGTLHNVTNIIIHESYNTANWDYDVGLVQVNPGFTFNNNVRPITLECDLVIGGTYGVVTGWGYSPEIGDYSTTLRQVTLQIRSDLQCRNAYGPSVDVTNSMICAGNSDGVAGACAGDFGAPLVATNKLIGMFSWGWSCGDIQHPDVFTKISAVCGWIQINAGV